MEVTTRKYEYDISMTRFDCVYDELMLIDTQVRNWSPDFKGIRRMLHI